MEPSIDLIILSIFAFFSSAVLPYKAASVFGTSTSLSIETKRRL